ncbi:hypothetical protein DPMN_132346 [Dreissena polymorpha]|uniref:G-protein coupled receptors family 1 profile domain-containing protein n=1 Tax=Dreissena polymorpha TaxID=45954 RepID=A0A9D4FS99_DREPO|nr:hypothetical protein DPMN_132346 [Dreissena polymorpha]
MTFAMSWGFLVCWMPYSVVSMWSAYGNADLLPMRLVVVSVLLAKSSTVVNPIIYFLLNSKFRPMLLRTLNNESVNSQSFRLNGSSTTNNFNRSGTQDEFIHSDTKSNSSSKVACVANTIEHQYIIINCDIEHDGSDVML